MKNIRKIISIILIIVIFLIVAGGAVYLKYKVNAIYDSALDNLANGQYEQAISEFKLIGDFKNSTSQLEQAESSLTYDNAENYLEAGKYDEAAELFESLGEFSESPERYKEARYKKALDLFENGNYNDAQLIFSELGDYEESVLYKARCSLALLECEQEEVYVHAKKLMNQKKYEDAKEFFSQIMEYKDSGSLYAKCERMIHAKTTCAGIQYSLAINEDKTVCIAYNEAERVFDFSNWKNLVSISGVGGVIVALDEDGRVYSTAMPSFPYRIDVSDWGEVIQVSVGERFAVGLKSNHTLVSIGRYEDGQRELSSWSDIVQVATTYRMTVGLDSKGELHFAGHHEDEFREQYEQNRDAWKDVLYIDACGGRELHEMGHVVGITSEHKIVMLGDSFESDDSKVYKWEHIKKIACGNNHLIAVDADNQLHIIGDPGTINYDGQDEKEKFENWPMKDVVDISAGYNLTLALTNSGEVYAAGNEHQGQLSANKWDNIRVIQNKEKILIE